MLLLLYAKALLALSITLTVSVTSSSGASTCGDWYQKTLLKGGTLRMRAVLIKREPYKDAGRIKSAKSPFKSAYLKPGLGACGKQYVDTNRGACLWDGSKMKTPKPTGLTPGWLTNQHKKNCGREIFINRKKVRAEGRILDACSFADGNPLTIEEGCSTIYVTRQTYIDLGGNPEDKQDPGRIELDDWDFFWG